MSTVADGNAPIQAADEEKPLARKAWQKAINTTNVAGKAQQELQKNRTLAPLKQQSRSEKKRSRRLQSERSKWFQSATSYPSARPSHQKLGKPWCTLLANIMSTLVSLSIGKRNYTHHILEKTSLSSPSIKSCVHAYPSY